VQIVRHIVSSLALSRPLSKPLKPVLVENGGDGTRLMGPSRGGTGQHDDHRADQPGTCQKVC